MSLLYLIGAALALALMVYLCIALLYPERF